MDRHTIFRLAIALVVVGAVVANPLGSAFIDDNSPVQDSEAIIAPGGCALPQFFLGQCDTAENATADNLQDHIELYQHVVSVRSATRSFMAMTENYLTDTQDVAWIKAEEAVFNAAMNGSDETTATIDVKNSLRDYYTRIQRNAYDNWNTQVASLESTHNQAQNISGDQFYVNWDLSTDMSSWGWDTEPHIESFDTTNITLINGSEMDVRRYNVQASGDVNTNNADEGDVSWSFWIDPTDVMPSREHYKTVGSVNEEFYPNLTINSIRVFPPTTDYSHARAIYAPGWDDFDTRITQEKDEAIAEAENFTQATYADLQSGTINVSDALSRVTKMNNFVVQSTDSDSTFNELVAGLVGSGMTVPEGLESGYMNITFNPLNSPNSTVTKDGLLLSSTNPPNGSWEVGKTYNASDISGGELVVGLDGTQTTVNQTSGTITINGAFSANGTELDQTTFDAPDRDYRTANTSELQSQIVSLTEDINDLEERLSDDGGSGGLDLSGIPNPLSSLGGAFAGAFGTLATYAIVAFLALLVLGVVTR